MGNQLKQIRGQIRQIVKELLPEILTNELIAAVAQQTNKVVSERLNSIDERQKEMTSYIVRNQARNQPMLKPEVKKEESNE